VSEGLEITIIGAGVVGLAIAAELSAQGREVLIVEKNDAYGREVSSRNSEVIHAGIYYHPGSLKAKLCVQGRHLLYDLCRRHGVPFKRIGKLIVAISHSDAPHLERLHANAQENGVADLQLLTGQEARRLEPQVTAAAALFSPSTGIISAHHLMSHFYDRAKSQGAQLVRRTEVVGVERKGRGYTVRLGDGFSYETRIVINCAGLFADRVAGLAGLDIERCGYRLRFMKGEYFSVNPAKSHLVQRLVYPVPPAEGRGLGIHVTLGLEGRMRLGPNARPVEKLDYSVDASQRPAFFKSVSPFLPFLREDDLEPDMAGIRPTLAAAGPFHDFIIQEEADRGLPGFVNLIGIESPGLTCAPAIARHVADLVGPHLN
jgi:L-2-hydroxyglutarate oxidase LhgO